MQKEMDTKANKTISVIFGEEGNLSQKSKDNIADMKNEILHKIRNIN